MEKLAVKNTGKRQNEFSMYIKSDEHLRYTFFNKLFSLSSLIKSKM